MKAKHSEHPFLSKPHWTLLALSLPSLFSLIAEPVTGLVDTAFVARLGAVELAALGVGSAVLSSVFWVFNFLGIGAQTEVAQKLGQEKREAAIKVTSLALLLSVIFGLGLLGVGYPIAKTVAGLLGAEGAVLSNAAVYIQIRLFAAPAVLITLTGFGVLRGMQDMKTPLWIATGINVLNVVLDAPFIFGFGVIPALGVAGSAWATAISQYLGAIWILWAIQRELGYTGNFRPGDAFNLIKVGGDLFIRTGSLTAFLLLATRVATQIGVESGAAHQGIRQIWFFTALTMEAFAITAQSLVGYFLGAKNIPQARQVASYCALWSFGTGLALSAAMFLSTQLVIDVFIPESAVAIFVPAWIIASLSQPLNALAFVTDGIHWGTGDYRYLRNGMITATALGATALLMIDTTAANAFLWVWVTTVIWIVIRSIFGILRVWPAVGKAPLKIVHTPIGI
jgi:MATE family multidrug resistance protein